jgi:hypothetical protein
MTAIRPNFLKILAPLAAFACTLAVIVWLGDSGEVELPGGAPAGPSGAERYASVGSAYLQKARENGDPTYYSRAERSFDAALRRDGDNVDALLGAGTLAGIRHDFREQLKLGLEARRLLPGLVDSYPVIADAQIELGRYRAAERTIQGMLDRKPNLTSYARVSYLRELTGDLAGAVQAMRLAVSAGAGVAENVAYVQTLLGDLELQRGRPAAARAAYLGALARQPRYAPAEAGLARAENAAGDLATAARRLRGVSHRLPLTSYLILLADTDKARGDHRAAARDLEVVRAQQRLQRAAGTRPDAELILFEANHGDPGDAVRLGRRLWDDAPSVRSADALGWALTRAGRPREGLGFARRALRLGSRDPLFNLHAGLAAKAAGRSRLAGRLLRSALVGRAALSPLEARAARAALEALR